MQTLVESQVYVDRQIMDYVSKIVRATREHPAIEVRLKPQGRLSLLKLYTAHAAMSGRDFVTPDDVKIFAVDALCHRLILKIEYEIEGTATPKSIVNDIVAGIEPPKDFMKR